MIRFLSYVTFLGVVCFAHGSVDTVVFAQSVTIRGDDSTVEWAFEPEQGRIFASVQETDEVVEYDIKGAQVRRFQVGQSPSRMQFKNNMLCVICVKDKSLWTIDLATNKATENTKLELFPRNVFCSKAKNNFVYCVCSKYETRSGSYSLKQIDIAKNTVRNSQEINRWGQSSPINVAMSDDGNWIVPDARGHSSPSGADLMRVNEEEFEFVQVKDYHDSFGQIVSGPAGRYWALGNQLYSADLKKLVRSFKGICVAFHPHLDLVACYGNSKIEFQSLSQGKSISSVAVADLSEKSTTSKKRLSSSALRAKKRAEQKMNRCFAFDKSGDHLVFASKANCQIFSTREPSSKANDLLLISAATNAKTTVGESISLPLKLTNPKFNSTAKFVVAKGPEGATVSSGKLTWRSTASYIGNQVFTINATAGDLSDSLKITVEVKAPRVELGFTPSGAAFNAEGTHALVWGKKMSKDQRERMGFGNDSSGADEVAIVNLPKQKIEVKKTLSAGVRSAAIVGDYALLLTKSGNVFYRFDRDTLGNSKRRFLKRTPVKLLDYSNQEVAILGDSSGNRKFTLFNAEKFEESGTISMDYASYSASQGGNEIFSRISKDLIDHRSKIANMNGETRAIKNPNTLPNLSVVSSNSRNRNFGGEMFGRSSPGALRFGRKLNGNQLVNHAGSLVKNFQSNSSYGGEYFQVSPFAPVVFGLTNRIENQNDYNNAKVVTSLEIRSLIDGSIIESQTIDIRPRNQSSRSYNRSMNLRMMNIFENFVYVFQDDAMLVVPISKTGIKKAPAPLHIQWPSFKTLGVDGVQSIQVTAVGESTKLEYALMKEYPGIEIDKTSGTISLDTPKIWKAHLEKLVPSVNQKASLAEAMMIRDRSRSSNSTQSIPEVYEELCGTKLPKDKTPFVLPIDVAVSDEEGQEDRISYFVVVLAPKGELEKVEKEKNAQILAQREKMEKRRAADREMARKRNEEMMKRREAEKGIGSSKTDSRIDALEKRMRRMEAAIDAILGKLEKMESGKEK